MAVSSFCCLLSWRLCRFPWCLWEPLNWRLNLVRCLSGWLFVFPKWSIRFILELDYDIVLIKHVCLFDVVYVDHIKVLDRAWNSHSRHCLSKRLNGLVRLIRDSILWSHGPSESLLLIICHYWPCSSTPVQVVAVCFVSVKIYVPRLVSDSWTTSRVNSAVLCLVIVQPDGLALCPFHLWSCR